jgi:pimeloyl-ACP methyl ester carboxylesterase
MILVIVVAALAILALVTQAGVFAVQRAYPSNGRMIEVAGATLNVVDIGPRDAAGPPLVMIHGASSNLEVMRQPLGEMLARNHRVILIDRPGHGWSTRARLEDSTPAIQGRMIDDALEKLGVGRATLVVHSWSGALGARMALDYPKRVAGLVMLAPVAYPWRGGIGWYTKLVAIPVIGPLLAYTITLPLGYFLGLARRPQRVLAASHAGWLCRQYRDGVVVASARIPRQCARYCDPEGRGGGSGCRRW